MNTSRAEPAWLQHLDTGKIWIHLDAADVQSQMRADALVVEIPQQDAEATKMRFVQAIWIHFGDFWSQNCIITSDFCTFTTESRRFFLFPDCINFGRIWKNTTHVEHQRLTKRLDNSLARQDYMVWIFEPFWLGHPAAKIYPKKHDEKNQRNRNQG